jgi:hypothetical protein
MRAIPNQKVKSNHSCVVYIALLFISNVLADDNFGFAQKIERGLNRPGNDYENFTACHELQCKKACDEDKLCQAWTFVVPGKNEHTGRCWLKDRQEYSRELCDTCISGVKYQNH